MHTRYRNQLASWRTRLTVEALEELALMSASPLVWTAPAVGHTANQIGLTVLDGRIEIFDNGHLAASQNVADTSAITINTNAKVHNAVTIAATAAGVPTTVNLKGPDSVLVGDTDLGQTGPSNGNPFLRATNPAPSTGSAGSKSLLHGPPPPPTVPAGTLANILGDVTIKGIPLHKDTLALADGADTAAAPCHRFRRQRHRPGTGDHQLHRHRHAGDRRQPRKVGLRGHGRHRPHLPHGQRRR